jgi:hypothetical protein
MKPQIRHHLTGLVLFEGEAGMTTRQMLEKATASRVNLSGADLSGANLSGASLSGASLSWASLSRVNLSGADLSGANLSGASLSWANLSEADLSRASLSWASLSWASLSEADLSRVNLSGANLSGANLSGASLSGANLSGANLSWANLSGVKNADLVIARTRILSEGDLIGWKKCKNNVIVKMQIPSDAKRSHAFGRKCRAEYVKVLEVIGAEAGIAQYDGKTEYRKGEIVKPDSFDENWQDECAPGIHFFITRIEAENY